MLLRQTRPIAIFLTAVLLASCSYIPFSGGELEGSVAAPLDDWQAVADKDIIQLETNPQAPYSVNLWMIAESTHLYVYAGDNHADWAQHIDSDENVRMKIGEVIYELAATRVLDQAEFQHFTKLWLDKYGSDRTDSLASNTYLYKLVARAS